MVEIVKNCKTCGFCFDRYCSPVCRAHPPVANPNGIMAMWPAVHPTWCCGEWVKGQQTDSITIPIPIPMSKAKREGKPALSKVRILERIDSFREEHSVYPPMKKVEDEILQGEYDVPFDPDSISKEAVLDCIRNFGTKYEIIQSNSRENLKSDTWEKGALFAVKEISLKIEDDEFGRK